MEHLPRVQSDHCPLLIKLSQQSHYTRHSAFKFESAWLTRDDFHQVVDMNWDTNLPFQDNTSNVTKKLQELNSFNIFHNKRRLWARIAGVQRILAIHPSANLIKLDEKLRGELYNILHQEELYWFQRSREEWIFSGDRNTRFFHVATVVNRSRNRILRLKEKRLVENPTDRWQDLQSSTLSQRIQSFPSARERVPLSVSKAGKEKQLKAGILPLVFMYPLPHSTSSLYLWESNYLIWNLPAILQHLC